MSDKESTAGFLRDKRPLHRRREANESNEGAYDAKKHKGKAGHKGATDSRKPFSSRKHFQEKSKHNEVGKGKGPFKKSNNRDVNADSPKEGSNNDKKTVDRSSHKGIPKNKHLPVKSLKIVPKSGRLEKRAAVSSEDSGSQDKG